jgi:hypothetical protein
VSAAFATFVVLVLVVCVVAVVAIALEAWLTQWERRRDAQRIRLEQAATDLRLQMVTQAALRRMLETARQEQQRSS